MELQSHGNGCLKEKCGVKCCLANVCGSANIMDWYVVCHD